MPEKTDGAKRHSPVAHTLDRFFEGVRDEPEHAAYFAQETPEDPADLLERDCWRRDQSFFGRVLFFLSHVEGEAAPVQESEKAISSRWRSAGARSTCSKRKKIMSARFFLICGLVAVAALAEAQQFGRMSSMKENKTGLVVHGGAGTMERGKMTPERESEYRAGIENALRAGWEILKHGGSSLDATEAAVRTFEDDPLFNAGKGAVFSAAGTNEMDAAIMDGKTLKAGAVADIQHVKNPIGLARLVMEKSPHILISGQGAENFAKEHGVELVDQKYFFTQERWDALQKTKAAEKSGNGEKKFIITDQDLHGTVGAVALD